MIDFFQLLFVIKAYKILAPLVMAFLACLFGRLDQTIFHGLCLVLHDAQLLVSGTGTVTGFAADALEICSFSIADLIPACIIAGGMALQALRLAFAAFFFQRLKGFGMGTFFPCFIHHTLFFALVAHLAFFGADVGKISGITHREQETDGNDYE